MPYNGIKNLSHPKPGEVRNPYGAAGKPETREKKAKKAMEEKIIKEAVLKELERVVEESGMTVLEILVRKTIQNAANGNDRIFSKLVDMIDGPIVQKSENKIDSNQPNVVLYIPEKDDNNQD